MKTYLAGPLSRNFIYQYKKANRRAMRICLFVFFAVSGTFTVSAQTKRFSFTEPKMGSPFTIILYTGDSATAAVIAEKSYALVDSLVNILSDYIDSSELNRLCARSGSCFFKCSRVLYQILLQSKKAFIESDGKFDISLGPLTRLWRTARKSGRFPDSAEVTQKRSLTGFNRIKFDRVNHSVFLTKTGMQLDLGGIGQGFIAEQLADYLKTQNINTALIDVSGDIVAFGHPPGTKGWTVAINVPESEQDLLPRHLLIADKAVTTSGDVYQFMLHEGKKYSHIIDPATGYGITAQRNVTVIAKEGTAADWLTKAFSLLPEAKARKLAANQKAEFLITEIRDGHIKYQRSRNFDTYWKKEVH